MGAVIFLICCLTYLANGETITSNDNIPNAILALNWFDSGVLHFDSLRNSYIYENASQAPYFFVEAPNGHLTSTYPIGTAIITFPIYLLFWVLLRSAEWAQSIFIGSPVDLFDITQEAFRSSISDLQKVAATLVASLTVLLFYLSVRLKFPSPLVPLVSTFIFAFCTTTWMISSQGLWQHGSANLIVVAILFALLKANRVGHARRQRLLFVVGILCGLLPGVRPTSIIFALAAIAYTVFTFRRNAMYLFLGLPSLLLGASWNFYFFGFDPKYFLVGGYSRFASDGSSFTQQYYVWSWQQFKQGFLGTLLSPNRGLLIFSPVTILALPGLQPLARHWKKPDEQLLLLMTGAALILFIQYCFFTVWTGGWTYGPRYMTDLLPVIGWLIAYTLDTALQRRFRHWMTVLAISIVGILMAFSLFTQVVGAFSPNVSWDAIPSDGKNRIWQWRDNQILRHSRGLYYRIQDPLDDTEMYLAGFEGAVVGLQDRKGHALSPRLASLPNRVLYLAAVVQNSGQSQWFGYQTGLGRGTAIVKAFLMEPGSQDPQELGRLYVSGNPRPGEQAIAVGGLSMPQKPGRYRIILRLGLAGIRDTSHAGGRDRYEVQLLIRKPSPRAHNK